ncbi:GerAB/ArcD/ProY family transporter [Paenibacillus caseinilyticus]|uniref:Spore germination protein n=1 Tax=Paenibacillus mucilaginosus K02 TaxID=997761 RepID=I0BRH7_9BACL|nr:GerAB/ArcD/ProY family transporter [Paenibacillus mucilaginosus]AFH64974.1 spore germination protein [Paenibacillus mucilaginosus K02]
MAKLSSYETFSLMFGLLLGTSVIFGTPKLVHDLWLVDIMALIPGLLMAWIYYTAVGALGQRKGLYNLLVEAWGKYCGKLLILSYTVYFLYIAARNVRDMVELVKITLLRDTPEWIITIMFVLVAAYAVGGGIKVIGRFAEITAALVIIFFLGILLLLLMSGYIQLEKMLPFLPNGLLPILKESLAINLWFPYGEMVVFLVLYNNLCAPDQIRKVGLAAVLSAGLLLTMSDLLQTWVLGVEQQQISAFPLLDSARLINVGNFITRMDALVAFIIMFGVMVKSAIFLYAGTKGLSLVFQTSSRNYVYPLSLVIGAVSLMVSKNFAEHGTEGLQTVIKILHIPHQLILPLITGLMVWIRMKRRERADEALG